VLGELLLAAIVVIGVTMIAVGVVLPLVSGGTAPPNTALSVSATTDTVVVDHGGGEAVPAGELTLLVSGRDRQPTRRSFGAVHDGSFADGDTARFPLSASVNPGDRLRVQVVHEPSGAQLFDGRKLVATTGDVTGGDRLVWSSPADWDAGTGERVVHDDIGDRRSTRLQIGYDADPERAPGLLGYYPLDGTEGTTVPDATGLNDGALLDDSDASYDAVDRSAAGVFGSSGYRFDPQTAGRGERGAHVDLGTGTSDRLAATGSFTWAAWIRMAPDAGNKDTILAANRQDFSNNLLWFVCQASCNARPGTTGPARLTVYDGSFHPIGPRVNDGTWHHVAVTLDGDTGRVTYYVDGAAVGGYTTDTRIGPDDVLSVGQDYDDADFGDGFGTSDFFEGDLEEVRVFDRALPADAVAAEAATEGRYTSRRKAFDRAVPADGLTLAGVDADPDGGAIEVVVAADTDDDGTFEARSDPVPLEAGRDSYALSFDGDVTAASYRVVVTMRTGPDPTRGPTLDRVDVRRP
jgi:hypothetical protein